MEQMKATTICAVRKDGKTAIAGDGQVTFGKVAVMKSTACKIRKLHNGTIIAGFAGAVADAFTLYEKFEAKLMEFQGNLSRAAVALAQEWRSNKVLKTLEALLLVADKDTILIVSGNGEVIEPDGSVVGIGSGGFFAMAAGRALEKHSNLSASEIAREAVSTAADLCIYTNHNIKVEEL